MLYQEMNCLRYRNMFANLAYLAVISVIDFRPFLFGAALKVFACLVLSYLLLFALLNSANLEKIVASCLRALPVRCFAPPVLRRWRECSSKIAPALDAPSFPSLFQRPPPMLSSF